MTNKEDQCDTTWIIELNALTRERDPLSIWDIQWLYYDRLMILTCNTCHKTLPPPLQMSPAARELRTSENDRTWTWDSTEKVKLDWQGLLPCLPPANMIQMQ